MHRFVPVSIVRTDSRDVRRNLAVEEWLLDRAEASDPVLMLWRNDSAVVIGKNQNPWLEVRLDRLAAAGAILARRASGGGAVYHDPGNLNFSLILPRALHDTARQFALVRRALAAVGAVSEVRNRTGLFLGERKFSGSSFCLRGRSALHHGTLLVASDLDRLRGVLGPPGYAIDTAAVRSVPAPVVNLADAVPGLTPDRVASALEAAFEEEYGATERVGDDEIATWGWAPAAARHADDAWVLDATPRFTARWTTAAGRSADVVVGGGRVESAVVSCAASAGPALVGRRFDPAAVERLLEGAS